MIKQLEAASYQVWVESNTDFLEASFDMSDYEEDDYMWDDDYMFSSSGSDTLDRTTLDEVADDSSVCSSIRQCDDSQSFHGYLASSEGYDSAHASSSVNESSSSISFAGRNVLKGSSSAKEKIMCSSINSDVESDWIGVGESVDIPKCPSSPKEEIMCSSINSDVTSDQIDVDESLEISNNVHGDKDDWVVVDRNLDRNQTSGDWLVVSTTFSKILKDESGQRVKHGKFECLKNEISHQQKTDSDNVDLSDWTVLSMKVTESDRVVKADPKNQKNDQKLRTDIKFSHKHKTRAEEKIECKSSAKCENHSNFETDGAKIRHCHCCCSCSCFKDKVNSNSAVLNLDQKSNLPCMVVYVLMPGNHK